MAEDALYGLRRNVRLNGRATFVCIYKGASLRIESTGLVIGKSSIRQISSVRSVDSDVRSTH